MSAATITRPESPLILIGSELHQLAELKSQALAGLDAGIALYRQHNPTCKLGYFGLHTRQEAWPSAYKLFWHDKNPGDRERAGLIISVGLELEFLEVVNAAWSRLQWIRTRQ